MNRPTVIEGILIALGISLLTLPLWIILNLVLGGFAAKAVVVSLGYLYVIYALRKQKTRTGTVILGSMSAAVLACAAVMLSFVGTVLVSAAVIWFVRSVIAYSSVISSALDAALCLIGLGAAIWAWQISGSVVAGTWCFFLVQALFVFIPTNFQHDPVSAAVPGKGVQNAPVERFRAAHSAAEAALAELYRKTAQ